MFGMWSNSSLFLAREPKLYLRFNLNDFVCYETVGAGTLGAE